ncbi:MAG TPA: glycosyltransferase [Galbitalea sp.]
MSEDLGTGIRGVVAALLPGKAADRERERHRLRLEHSMPLPTAEAAWLMLAVLGRRLPTSEEVERAYRFGRFNGTRALVRSIAMERLRHPSRWFDAKVSVLRSAVLLDVHDSIDTHLLTGVQRLARGIAESWIPRGATLIGWSPGRTQLRVADPRALQAAKKKRRMARRGVVPWQGHYVLAEVVTEPERSVRTQALAQYAQSRTMLVGADIIPLTTAETTGPRMPGVFAKYLAAAARMSVVAAISSTAAAEYAGWRGMLRSAGIGGPEIVNVPIAETAGIASPDARAEAERLLLAADDEGTLPLVLSVGSHEPRKNHGAVLAAAELLWREGLRFNLVFIGGNAWSSDEFRMRLAALSSAGRPIQSLSGASDAILWWAYRLARLTVFPSVNEGFGLPVVESLHSGTPVVTSRFGSMEDIARGGGCVLVDPHDDRDVAAGIRSLLLDDALHDRLAAEAVARPLRSWGAYAGDLWRILVG